jgi:hypothetical protein
MKSLRFHFPETAFEYFILSSTRIKQSFKLVLLATLFTLLFLIFGCSKNEEDVKPDNGDTEPPPVTSISKTIGKNGGILELDSISLFIPSGAFSEEISLELSLVKEPVPYPQPSVTGIYKLTGLPGQFDQPVRLSLKYSGFLEGDSYIAWGHDQTLPIMDTTIFAYDLVDCQDSAGYLAGYLMPPEANIKEGGRKNELFDGPDSGEIFDYFMGITSYRIKKTDHFDSIIYPTTLDPAYIDVVAGNLESIYQKFTDFGFNVNNFPHFKLSKTVKLFDFRDQEDFHSKYKFKYFHLSSRKKNFNFSLYSYYNDAQLRLLIGSEFFDSFLWYLYNENGFWLLSWKTFDNSVRYWLEEKWEPPGNPEDFIPSCFTDEYYTIPLDIFPTYYESNCEMIKFLSTRFGQEYIIDYYKKIINCKDLLNCERRFKALFDCLDEPVHIWLSNFFQNLFLGSIYNFSGEELTDKILNKSRFTSTHTLPQPNNTESHSHNDILDLSAKVFYFNMNNQKIAEKSFLTFSISSDDVDIQNLHGFLCSINRNTKDITFIDIGTTLDISDPLSYKNENKDIFIVVVNSQSENLGYEDRDTNLSSIKLDVSFIEVIQLTYHRMRIDLDSVNIIRKYNDNRSEFYENQYYQFSFPPDEMYEGGFSITNTFTGSWDYMDDLFNYWGEVSATVDPQTLFLKDFDFVHGNKYSNSNSEKISEFMKRIIGIDIQMEQKPGLLYAKIKGEDIIDHVQIFEYLVEYTDPIKNQTDGYYHIIDFTENSILEITFYDEN